MTIFFAIIIPAFALIFAHVAADSNRNEKAAARYETLAVTWIAANLVAQEVALALTMPVVALAVAVAVVCLVVGIACLAYLAATSR